MTILSWLSMILESSTNFSTNLNFALIGSGGIFFVILSFHKRTNCDISLTICRQSLRKRSNNLSYSLMSLLQIQNLFWGNYFGPLLNQHKLLIKVVFLYIFVHICKKNYLKRISSLSIFWINELHSRIMTSYRNCNVWHLLSQTSSTGRDNWRTILSSVNVMNSFIRKHSFCFFIIVVFMTYLAEQGGNCW